MSAPTCQSQLCHLLSPPVPAGFGTPHTGYKFTVHGSWHLWRCRRAVNKTNNEFGLHRSRLDGSFARCTKTQSMFELRSCWRQSFAVFVRLKDRIMCAKNDHFREKNLSFVRISFGVLEVKGPLQMFIIAPIPFWC